MKTFQKIGSQNQFPTNKTTAVTVSGQPICIANHEGSLTAFDDSCSHAAALLSGSAIENGCVNCPLHGAKFDVASGTPQTLPATEPLKMHELKIEASDVFISLNND